MILFFTRIIKIFCFSNNAVHDISPGTEIYVTICRLQSITINRSIYGCLLNEKIPEELMTLKIIKKVNLKVKQFV